MRKGTSGARSLLSTTTKTTAVATARPAVVSVPGAVQPFWLPETMV